MDWVAFCGNIDNWFCQYEIICARAFVKPCVYPIFMLMPAIFSKLFLRFGWGKISGSFLTADLIDEVSILIGPEIDGRTGPSLFDGRSDSHPVTLQLKTVQSYNDDAVWLRYPVK